MSEVPFAPLFRRGRAWVTSGRAARTGRAVAPVFVFLTALAPRWWFVGQHPVAWYLVSNMASFDARARHLIAGDASIVETFTPIGYPALVALAHLVTRDGYELVGWAQALLGAATCTLAHALARRLTRSEPVALGVGLVLSGYLPLVVYTGYLLTETLFGFLVTLFALLLLRCFDRPSLSRVVLAGVVFGAAAVVRSNLILAGPLLLALSLLMRRRNTAAWRAPLAALGCAVPLVLVAVADNSRIAGRLTGVATNGGVNFFLGHCECRAVTFPRGSGIALVSGHQNRVRYEGVVEAPVPAYDEAYFYRAGLRLFVDHPRRVVGALINVGDGLMLTGMADLREQPYYPGWSGHDGAMRAFARAIAWLAILPVALHAAARALQRRPLDPARGVLLALAGSAVATLYLYLGDPRMRVPFDPLLVVLAAEAWLGFAVALRRAVAGRSEGQSPLISARLGVARGRLVDDDRRR